ncbi:efflux RND transporter periplasmic adaptor subunit [bacterium]|nr:efflux RND transporter periplasmic adaptor subunit [bacterium]
MQHKSILKLIGLIPLVLFIQSCSRSDAESKSMEQIHKAEGVPVRIEQVQESSFSSVHSAYSVLTGIQESTAYASLADKIDSITQVVGDKVTKDQTVITFPADNPAAQYMQAKIAYEHAETTLNRMTTLYESGGISKQELDNINTQFKVTEANWDAVQQMILVRAPISGTITRIAVQESDNVNPGDALFTVAQTERLKTQLWITENQINEIKKGDIAQAIWRHVTLTGRVTQVDLSLNSEMQAFGVQVEFANKTHKLRSGINAEIRILSGNNQNKSIIIARKDIITQGGHQYVFIDKQGTAQKVQVQTGRGKGLDIEITKGLKIGDRLITEGVMLLKDGVKIRITDAQ